MTFGPASQLAFEEMLNTIAWEWATSSESRAKFIMLGVDPAQWTESKTKALLVEFEKTKSEKARFDLIKHLEVQERGELPDTEGEFRGAYESQLKLARAKELAAQLSRNPERVDEILSRYHASKSLSHDFLTLHEILSEGVKDLERRIENKRAFIELPNWPILSRMIKGFNGGRVITLAAKTGGGKTTLALNWALNMAKIMPTTFYNMEMPLADIAAKIYQSASASHLSNWYRGEIDYGLISATIDGAKYPLRFSSGVSLAIDQITSSIFIYSQEDGPGFFIIDYDQKISTRYGVDEWKALHLAIQELEQVAIKTESTIVLLSQANDDGDPKASKRMVQTAAVHLVFDQDERGFFIQARKNRFGVKDAMVSVHVDLAKGQLKEGIEIQPLTQRGF